MRQRDAVTVRDLRTLDWLRVKGLRAMVPEHVVFRDLPSETVLLDIETGAYHGMDEAGSRCFDALRKSPDLQSACDVLARDSCVAEEQIRRDLVAFCTELVSSGLLELREPSR